MAVGALVAVGLTSCNRRITDGSATSRSPDISADGRYVAFASSAPNLVPGDTNGHEDVFVWDRVTGVTTRVTAGDGNSFEPAISADGRHVAFTSMASDLVPNDPTAGADIFVWERLTDTTTAISDGNSPRQPAISGDGRYVAYESWDSQLALDDTPAIVDVFVWDRATAATTRITDSAVMDSGNASISVDGGHVAYSTAMHYKVEDPPFPIGNVFVWDEYTGATTQVTDGNNDSTAPDISADGHAVSFVSEATDLVPADPNGTLSDAYVWDATTGAIVRVGPHAREAAISDDGRHVAYNAFTAPAPGETFTPLQIFVWDRTTGVTTQTTNGTGWCSHIAASGDGRYLAYHCDAPDLVSGDTNGVTDIFVWDQLHWLSPGP